jgi:flagellar P-ring protein precursor FlgI
MIKHAVICLLLLIQPASVVVPELGFASAQTVELKALGRFEGWRENSLVGYGLVVGLSGSGDTRRSEITQQALRNVLGRLGTTVSEDQINSRNVAVVMVVGTLPPSANRGDKLPVTVSSAGDARSLAGGTLLLTPLSGADGEIYALAQGELLTGGFSFESAANLQQRNYPTTARLEEGATVEVPVDADLLQGGKELGFLLNEPSFITAKRVADSINSGFGSNIAWASGADEVRIAYDHDPRMLISFIADIQLMKAEPDQLPRLVINERTGTVVAGGNVTLSSVVIAQGDLKVSVQAENTGLQPEFVGGLLPGVTSLSITNTDLVVDQGQGDVVASFPSTTVADLVQGLSQAGVDTRRTISILQAIKSAGALHADIIVQ